VVGLGESGSGRGYASRGAYAGAAGVSDDNAGNRASDRTGAILASFGNIADGIAVAEGTDADVGVVDRCGDCLLY
ncbi:hypothetical protein, partial [Pseudomonas aeruginosa]|uniref:hypothetical protein n=1 Tax=Pseudomonas aeruginosa TaxID=287 RepID=UPI001968D6EE